MANRRFTQFYGSLHNKPVQLDCSFIVDSSNANGLGIRSLKGPGIANVFMHTSVTPAIGNPNPAAGLIFVNLQDNYNRYFFGTSNFLSPLSGTSISISTASSLTLHAAYTITALGTTTPAQWVTVGVPLGITPAVGVTFLAAATAGSGTGTVQASVGAGVGSVEVVGDPNTTLTSNAATVMGVSSGAYIIYQCVSTGVSSFTGATHTTTTIDGIASTSGLKVGQAISGAGIPEGTTIATIVNGTSITVSQAATATASGVTFVVSPANVLAAPANGTTVCLSLFLSNTKILNQGA